MAVVEMQGLPGAREAVVVEHAESGNDGEEAVVSSSPGSRAASSDQGVESRSGR